MKIIQVGSYPQNLKCIKGGIESSIFGLSNELKKQNEVFVFDLPRKDVTSDIVEENDGIVVYRFYSKGTNIMSVLRCISILKNIKSLRPDICHLHSSNFISLILYILCKFNRIPVLVTIHGLAHIEKRNELNKNFSLRNLFKYVFQSWCEFLLLTFTNQIIVDTKYVAKQINKYRLQKKIFRAPKCIVIPQGVDSSFFSNNPQVVCQKGMILSVGGINARKGHIKLIQSVSIVQKYYPEIKLIIAGTLTDQNYYNQLKSEIKNNDLTKNVSLVVNASSECLYELYSKADLFVLHSQEESQGIVLCEALAMGIPIVATNVGGIPYVIKDKKNGLLSDYNDLNKFAENILYLIGNRDINNLMRSENINSGTKYSWHIITSDIIKVYRKLLN